MQELMIILVKLSSQKCLFLKLMHFYNSRTQVAEQSKLIELGDLVIDKDNFKVTKNGEHFLLPKKNLIYFIF